MYSGLHKRTGGQMIKLLATVSIFLTNLEKKYLKRYGAVCHNNNECVMRYDTCECEQRNIFRRTASSIGNIIWKLENKENWR